jgi:hypothetical protein
LIPYFTPVRRYSSADDPDPFGCDALLRAHPACEHRTSAPDYILVSGPGLARPILNTRAADELLLVVRLRYERQ